MADKPDIWLAAGLRTPFVKADGPLAGYDAISMSVPVAQPCQDSGPAPQPHRLNITPERLGSEEFKRAYGLRYAYVSGAMVKGIASKDMVVRMGKAGFLSF